MLEYKDNIKVYKKDKNEYYTNTGCKINLERFERGVKANILKDNSKPLYDEIKAIRYSLLGDVKTFYFDIDEYTENVTLLPQQEKDKSNNSNYKQDILQVLEQGFIKVRNTGREYLLLITEDNGKLHLSASSREDEYIPMEDMAELREDYLPNNKKFGMFFPPQSEFINAHKNCFHLYEI